MNPGDLAQSAATGIDQIFLYNNIAITVLVVMCIFLIFGNIYQYRTGNNRQEKDFTSRLAFVQALADVDKTMEKFEMVLGRIERLLER